MKLVNFLEKIVIGIFFMFVICSGIYIGKDAFVQKVFAQRKYTDSPRYQLFCTDCNDPCPISGATCEKITIYG